MGYFNKNLFVKPFIFSLIRFFDFFQIKSTYSELSSKRLSFSIHIKQNNMKIMFMIFYSKGPPLAKI